MIPHRVSLLLFNRDNVCSQRNIIRAMSSLGRCAFNFQPKRQATLHTCNNNKQLLTDHKSAYRQLCSFRYFSSEPSNQDGPNEDKLDAEVPLLMDFYPRGMPNMFNSIVNFFMIQFRIRNIDPNFDWKVFIEGAKQALVLVSSHLANNRLDELDGLVDKEALEEIKENYKRLSMAQREELQILPPDVLMAFAHHIQVQELKEDMNGTKRHIVHFFIVFDCIRNFEEVIRAQAVQKNTLGLFKEMESRKVVCNYEFKRVYTEGSEPSNWVITKLLHIRETDILPVIIKKRFN